MSIEPKYQADHTDSGSEHITTGHDHIQIQEQVFKIISAAGNPQPIYLPLLILKTSDWNPQSYHIVGKF